MIFFKQSLVTFAILSIAIIVLPVTLGDTFKLLKDACENLLKNFTEYQDNSSDYNGDPFVYVKGKDCTPNSDSTVNPNNPNQKLFFIRHGVCVYFNNEPVELEHIFKDYTKTMKLEEYIEEMKREGEVASTFPTFLDRIKSVMRLALRYQRFLKGEPGLKNPMDSFCRMNITKLSENVLSYILC